MRAFVDLIFHDPAAVPYGKRLMYYGHDVDPEMLQVITSRAQDREKLRAAGEEGLPLMIENRTKDGHQRLWITLEYLKKWFRDLEVHVIEGGSHRLHDDYPDETIEWILGFAKGLNGKDYRSNKTT
ncbi:hypothetical protein EWM64_g7184 [Hericium alpestre]|uniref:AB hydrolase-1 domain-containing protein n=1 Tax=Hericium alpestre TaxID=135208 RepID=A0A4Y9ZRZ8_9AGAM|nr:hypothetical protein EWM64_g7184 [Hericium alpestre]